MLFLWWLSFHYCIFVLLLLLLLLQQLTHMGSQQ